MPCANSLDEQMPINPSFRCRTGMGSPGSVPVKRMLCIHNVSKLHMQVLWLNFRWWAQELGPKDCWTNVLGEKIACHMCIKFFLKDCESFDHGMTRGFYHSCFGRSRAIRQSYTRNSKKWHFAGRIVVKFGCFPRAPFCALFCAQCYSRIG